VSFLLVSSTIWMREAQREFLRKRETKRRKTLEARGAKSKKVIPKSQVAADGGNTQLDQTEEGKTNPPPAVSIEKCESGGIASEEDTLAVYCTGGGNHGGNTQLDQTEEGKTDPPPAVSIEKYESGGIASEEDTLAVYCTGGGNQHVAQNEEDYSAQVAEARRTFGQLSLGRRDSDVSAAAAVQRDYRQHEANLQARQQKMQKRAKRHTQMRLEARNRLRKNKVMSSVPAFAGLDETAIEALITAMEIVKKNCGDVIMTEGDESDAFYIVSSGECKAWQGERLLGSIAAGGEDSFFGEATFLGGRRKATVRVSSETAKLLVLSREHFTKLMESGKLGRSVMEGVRLVDQRRERLNSSSESPNADKQAGRQGADELPNERELLPAPPPPPPPPLSRPPLK
jgi:CRP-like cAMP-binding protein